MKRKLLWFGAVAVIVLIAVLAWRHRFRDYTPVEVALDLRAARAARGAEKPLEKYLENRYGSLSDAANRREAYLDFYNPGHIESLSLIVNRLPEAQRQAQIDAMAKWIANYRNSMSPADKE